MKSPFSRDLLKKNKNPENAQKEIPEYIKILHFPGIISGIILSKGEDKGSYTPPPESSDSWAFDGAH